MDSVAAVWGVMPPAQRRRLLRFINDYRRQYYGKPVTMAELPFVSRQELVNARIQIGDMAMSARSADGTGKFKKSGTLGDLWGQFSKAQKLLLVELLVDHGMQVSVATLPFVRLSKARSILRKIYYTNIDWHTAQTFKALRRKLEIPLSEQDVSDLDRIARGEMFII